MGVMAGLTRMPLVENGFGVRAGFLLVVAFRASYGGFARDFVRAMANVTRRCPCFFSVMGFIGRMAIGAISRHCPRFFMGPVTIGAIFAAVYVNG
jgi:hypothetical protein